MTVKTVHNGESIKPLQMSMGGFFSRKSLNVTKIWECKQTLQSSLFSLKIYLKKFWAYLGSKFKLNILFVTLAFWVRF